MVLDRLTRKMGSQEQMKTLSGAVASETFLQRISRPGFILGYFHLRLDMIRSLRSMKSSTEATNDTKTRFGPVINMSRATRPADLASTTRPDMATPPTLP